MGIQSHTPLVLLIYTSAASIAHGSANPTVWHISRDRAILYPFYVTIHSRWTTTSFSKISDEISIQVLGKEIPIRPFYTKLILNELVDPSRCLPEDGPDDFLISY